MRQPVLSRLPQTSEPALRQQLDRAFGRAVVDHAYASLLLADPTMALGSAHLAPEHYVQLQRVRALSLQELASQTEALFWPLSDAQALEGSLFRGDPWLGHAGSASPAFVPASGRWDGASTAPWAAFMRSWLGPTAGDVDRFAVDPLWASRTSRGVADADRAPIEALRRMFARPEAISF